MMLGFHPFSFLNWLCQGSRVLPAFIPWSFSCSHELGCDVQPLCLSTLSFCAMPSASTNAGALGLICCIRTVVRVFAPGVLSILRCWFSVLVWFGF